jgi:DNA-directed RNA polymerase subunit M/transcription elongation factor TFIIS
MEFCKQCDNLYYMKINSEDNDNLIYYCRNCGNEETNLSNMDLCVSKSNFKEMTSTDYGSNPYIKLDPTLPRIKNIKCPNKECSRYNSEREQSEIDDDEIIYIRYDDKNMKYLYLCPCCDYLWKNE